MLKNKKNKKIKFINTHIIYFHFHIKYYGPLNKKRLFPFFEW